MTAVREVPVLAAAPIRSAVKSSSLIAVLACALLASALSPRAAAAAGPAYLVKDILPGPDPNATSDPMDFTVLGNVVLFSADDGVHGRELWRTDGTAAGTILLQDIDPGPDSAFRFEPSPTLVSNGIMLFRATDGVHGTELWRTDGTAAGTFMVKDINPGAGDSFADNFLAFGGVVLFSAFDAAGGTELWRTDGTQDGTIRVADINPGPADSSPHDFTVSHGIVFFVADDGTHGCELWRTDGSEGGTALVKDTDPSAACMTAAGPYGMPPISIAPTSLTDVGGTLFFTTGAPGGGTLWKSDGTEAGTVAIAGFSGCAGFEVFSCPPSCLTDVAGTLYFQGEVWGTGRELWKSDGTPAGTVMIKDINPNPCVVSFTGGSDGCSSSPCGFKEMNGLVTFTATDGDGNSGLWETDGTASGTIPFPAPTPTPAPPIVPRPLASAMLDGVLIFGNGELYKSDGTAAGTELLKDINVSPASSFPTLLTDVDGVLFFFASDRPGAVELWRSDGTLPGTTQVKDLGSGTAMVLARIGNHLMFIADDGTGPRLWRSDGTRAGTIPLEPVNNLLSWEYQIVDNHGIAYFAANEPLTGTELWRSDGTVAGTNLLKDINPGVEGAIPLNLTSVGGTVFFTARDGTAGWHQLWKTDGTAAGTVKINNPDVLLGEPSALTNVNGELFFVLGGGSGWSLWKSDGTDAGTQPIRQGFTAAPPGSLVDFDGVLLFVAPADGQNGLALWRSDGTEAGTIVVSNIELPPVQGGFLSQAIAGGNLFFTFFSAGVGDELWKTNGTAAGTGLVMDIDPGPASSLPTALSTAGSYAIFLADDGVHGREPWISDGTAAGTRLLEDLAPGPRDSAFAFAGAFTLSGSGIFFAANDGTTGTELWAVPLSLLATQCVGDCDGDASVTIDEVITGVNIALGLAPIDGCRSLDVNHDGLVTVDELLEAVATALNGCP